jgi:hypothetical protein
VIHLSVFFLQSKIFQLAPQLNRFVPLQILDESLSVA